MVDGPFILVVCAEAVYIGLCWVYSNNRACWLESSILSRMSGLADRHASWRVVDILALERFDVQVLELTFAVD
jgi:hypothetical protein